MRKSHIIWLAAVAALFASCSALTVNKADDKDTAIAIFLPAAAARRVQLQGDITQFVAGIFPAETADEADVLPMADVIALRSRMAYNGVPGGTITIPVEAAGAYTVAMLAFGAPDGGEGEVLAYGAATAVVADGEVASVAITLHWTDTTYKRFVLSDCADFADMVAECESAAQKGDGSRNICIRFTGEFSSSGSDGTSSELDAIRAALSVSTIQCFYVLDFSATTGLANLGGVAVDNADAFKNFYFSACPTLETVILPETLTFDIIASVRAATGKCVVSPTEVTDHELSSIISAMRSNTNADFTLDLSAVSGVTALSASLGRANISTLVIGGSITSIENVCGGSQTLRTLTITNSVASVATRAFCSSALQSATVDMSEVDTSCFRECASLETLTLGENVVTCDFGTIRPDFAPSLKTITSEALTPPAGLAKFKNDIRLYLCTQVETIYVPEKALDAYKTAPGWKAFADIIRAIGDTSDTEYKDEDSELLVGISNATGEYAVAPTETTRVRLTKLVAAMNANTEADFTLDLSAVSGITELSGAWSEANISTLVIGGSITSVAAILCKDSTMLKSVTIGDSVVDIGAEAFYNCTSLESLTVNGGLHDGMHGRIFRNLSALRTLTLGENLTTLTGEGAEGLFSGYTALERVIVKAATPPTVSATTFAESTAPLYVPASAVRDYAEAEGWKALTERIVGVAGADTGAVALAALAAFPASAEPLEADAPVTLTAVPTLSELPDVAPDIAYDWRIGAGDEYVTLSSASDRRVTLTANNATESEQRISITVTATSGAGEPVTANVDFTVAPHTADDGGQ